MSQKLFGMDRAQQDKFAGRALWVLWPSLFFACVYFLFFSSPRPMPTKIAVKAYQGPKGCPKEDHARVSLSDDGCFSPKTLIRNGKSMGFLYRGPGYKNRAKPYYFEFHRNDNDAVAVMCYDGKFFSTEKTGNGCFISGISKNVFVIKGITVPVY